MLTAAHINLLQHLLQFCDSAICILKLKPIWTWQRSRRIGRIIGRHWRKICRFGRSGSRNGGLNQGAQMRSNSAKMATVGKPSVKRSSHDLFLHRLAHILDRLLDTVDDRCGLFPNRAQATGLARAGCTAHTWSCVRRFFLAQFLQQFGCRIHHEVFGSRSARRWSGWSGRTGASQLGACQMRSTVMNDCVRSNSFRVEHFFGFGRNFNWTGVIMIT